MLRKSRIAAGVQLIGPIEANASVGEKPNQCPVYDRRTDLAFDIVANDRDAGVSKLLRPMRVRGEEHGNAINHGNAGIQARLRVMFYRLLRPHRQIAQQNLGTRCAQRGRDVCRFEIDGAEGGIVGIIGHVRCDTIEYWDPLER